MKKYFLGIIVIICIFFYLLLYTDIFAQKEEIKVTEVSWETNIYLEKLVTKEKSDWEVPKNGRLRKSFPEIRFYSGNTPIFNEKYYYDIEEWEKGRIITAKGNDHSPYYEQVVLAEGTEPYNVGAEKEKRKEEILKIKGKTKDEKEKEYIINDKSWWLEINNGDTIIGLSKLGHLKKI